MQLPENHDVAKRLGLIFSRSLQESLKSVCLTEWHISVDSELAIEMAAEPDARQFSFAFNGKLEGEAYFVVRAADIEKLGLKQARTEETSEEELVALLTKGLAHCAGLLEKEFDAKQPSKVQTQHVDAQDMSECRAVQLIAETEDKQQRIPMLLFCNQKLANTMQVQELSGFSYPSVPEVNPGNLDLVLDVELKVILRFGQRQLPLREVLRLTSGSVVELDRQVDEPVELVLDGRVIARGEAVVVDGNYGMRVHEVC